MSNNMMQPSNGPHDNSPALMIEQLMQGMANTLALMNQRMEQLERQVKLLTPLTSAQEKALGEKIKQRAEELREEYRLSAACVPAIANAIRKELKLVGGVRALRELPRMEYLVYVERVSLWDDYSTMRAIRKNAMK